MDHYKILDNSQLPAIHNPRAVSPDSDDLRGLRAWVTAKRVCISETGGMYAQLHHFPWQVG
jgi:hypothetical protein